MAMRVVPITYSRSVKIADLDPQVAKMQAVIDMIAATKKAKPSATEIVFGSQPDETMEQEDTIYAAIERRGESAVYELFCKQDKTDYQNKKAAELANKALKADKRKGGEVIRINFDAILTDNQPAEEPEKTSKK